MNWRHQGITLTAEAGLDAGTATVAIRPSTGPGRSGLPKSSCRLASCPLPPTASKSASPPVITPSANPPATLKAYCAKSPKRFGKTRPSHS